MYVLKCMYVCFFEKKNQKQKTKVALNCVGRQQLGVTQELKQTVVERFYRTASVYIRIIVS